MKKLLLAVLTLSLSLGFASVGHAEEAQSYLFFKSQSKNGYTFTEYTEDGKTNTVWLDKNSLPMPKVVKRGDVFKGTFDEWELIEIKKITTLYP